MDFTFYPAVSHSEFYLLTVGVVVVAVVLCGELLFNIVYPFQFRPSLPIHHRVRRLNCVSVDIMSMQVQKHKPFFTLVVYAFGVQMNESCITYKLAIFLFYRNLFLTESMTVRYSVHGVRIQYYPLPTKSRMRNES